MGFFGPLIGACDARGPAEPRLGEKTGDAWHPSYFSTCFDRLVAS